MLAYRPYAIPITLLLPFGMPLAHAEPPHVANRDGDASCVVAKRCRGPSLDEATREALRVETAQGRKLAATLSDAGLVALSLYPFVVDWGLITTGIRQQADLSLRMLFVDAAVFGITLTSTLLTKRAVLRPRPYVRRCADVNPPAGCRADTRAWSFFSGHTSLSFSGAGLVCAHGALLDFYGSTAAAAASCATALTLAALTGTLRIIADKHYLSDVLVGAAVGLVVSLGLTHLIGYENATRHEHPAGQASAPLSLGWGTAF